MEIPPLEAVRAELARRRLLDFTMATFPGYEAGWFAREVCAELDWFLAEVRAKQSPRMILQAPPRHGKSEIVSRRFPAFAMGQGPDLSIIATSYAADLASRMNRDVQRIIDSPGYRALFPETTLWGKNVRSNAQGSFMRNSDLFEVVGHRGSYRSAGVGGGITGMGGDILIIDDPIKDAEQANSPVYRAKVWEWFTSTLYTRRMPGGGVLIILTRWHEDDLAGRLIAAAQAGEGEPYRVVSFPAIAEKDEHSALDGRLLRREGEALHPERYSLEELAKIRQAVGSRVWASLYQQRPAAAEGTIFRRGHVGTFHPDHPPKYRRVIISLDTAFKEKEENDFSVATVWGEWDAGFDILDRWKERASYPALKAKVRTMADAWRPRGLTALLVEDKASGQSLIQELKKETSLPVVPIQVDRDKVTRAHAVVPLWEAGKVRHPEGADWVDDWLEQLYGFPKMAHDDDVDSTTQALNYLNLGGGETGILEFYRQEAEKARARKEGRTA